MITDPDYMRLGNQPWYLRWFVGIPSMALWVSIYQNVTAERAAQGGPVEAEFLVALIVLIIVLIAQEILRPKPEFEDARPGGNGDFQFVTATEGRVQPIIWGRSLLNGPNCIWYGDIQARPINESIRTGWFSKEHFISGYNYTMGVQFGLCRGPDVELVRVWLGREQKWLVYDGTVSGIITGEGRFDIDEPTLHFPTVGGVTATCDFYPGNNSHTVNAYLDVATRQRVPPMTTAPAYNGMCNLVVRQMTSAAPTAADVGAYIGDSTNVDPWSIELQRFPAVFSGQAAGEHKVPANTGLDCNPMNVIYEILTNLEWGLGFTAGEIDVGPGSSFLAAADTMLTEVNGWSMVLDKQIPATELLGEVERQVDGIVFLGQDTGTWQIKLARNDYTIGTLPLLDETNSEFKDYQRATWEDTTNQLTVKFNKRADNYKESYAVAQDEANIIMQGAGSIDTGRVVAGNVAYPGCKLSALASQLVWRSLRTRAYPLARATFMVNREFWALKPGDVFKWTNAELDISELPMRVVAIDFGKLTENKITITAVQDIFEFLGPSFGDPPDSEWIPPIGTVIDYPTDERIAFEMPRAMLVRHPDYVNPTSPWLTTTLPDWGGDLVSRIMCAAKRQGPETKAQIWSRNHPTTPTGSYALAGAISSFMEIGVLDANLSYSSAVPQATITINPGASSQAALLAAVTATNASSLGTDLNNIAVIGDELILFESAVANGADVDLTNCYRGSMDTVQATHSAGDDVYILSGASQTDLSFPLTDKVELKFLPQSFNSTLAIGSATLLALTMNTRAARPYAPSTIQYNSAGTDYGTPDLEGDGAGLNGFGVTVEWRRRNNAATDEIVNITADQTTQVTTDYQLEIRHTPYSASDIVHTGAWDADVTTPAAGLVTRLAILSASPNAAYQNLQFRIRSRHTYYNTYANHQCIQETEHLVAPTSVLSGQVAMGKQTSAGSALPTSYAAVSANLHTVTLGALFSAGNVEYRLNAGAWTNLITAGGTTGSFTPAASDVIELRHTASGTPSPNFVSLDDNGTDVAYGLFED